MLQIDLVVLTIADGRLRILTGARGLPSRSVREGEPLDRAAEKLLREQITARHLYLEQLYTFAQRGGRVVVGYLALAREAQIKGEGQWRSARPLPQLPDGQQTVAEYGLTRLRNKIAYTNLAFAFLPDHFTLSELQGAYEAVLERDLDKRNFRKKILNLGILSADGVARHSGGRPARLYQFNGSREVVFWRGAGL